MFKNIGKKVKTVAEVLFWFDVVLCVLLGIVIIVAAVMEEQASAVLTGFLVMILGPVISWLSAIMVYAFGELVDNSTTVAKAIDKKSAKVTSTASATPTSATQVTLKSVGETTEAE